MSQQNATNSNRPPLPPGFRLTELGGVEYVIEKTLSTTGGFGITYLATKHFMKHNRAVVIKENYPTGTARRNQTSGELTPYDESEEFFHSTRDKFLREAQIIRHLKHPNIVRVYSVFEALGTAYYTMPYLEGANELWQAVPTSDKIDEAWLLPILQKLLGALAYLHDFGVLHRDLKTNNIMLRQDGTPVIIDFGIARSIDAEATTSLQLGSPGFSPPEQGSTNAGFSADLYSLGATCYHLLAGKIPPAAQDRLGTDPYQPLSNMAELRERFSDALLGSIDRALRPMPNDRWQSAQEWMAAIDSSHNTTATPVNGTRVPTIEEPAPTPKITQQAAQAELRQKGISAAEYDSKLIEAAENGDDELVKLLIAADADVNKADKDGETPLYRAAYWSHPECVKLLLAAPGIDVNKADKDGETPLYKAASNGRTECVKLLIAAGADVNKADKDGLTPLYSAAKYGRTECVKLLIAAGADVNMANKYGNTPLYSAAKYGRTECVKLLIAAGADVNKADKKGKTPLSMAAGWGHTECVKLLLDAPGIDLSSFTPLSLAVIANNTNKLQNLLAAGADINRADEGGKTPLFWAAHMGHTECVKLLIAAGADVNMAEKEGKTPLYRAASNGHTECVKQLLAAGADVNKADDRCGETPLYWAAWNGHTECVKLLIAAGADVNKAGICDWTPLYRAAYFGHTECVKLLIDAGADVNKANKWGDTPLYRAESNGHTECAELLRAAGNTHVPTIEEPAPTPKITKQAAQAELQRRGISAGEYDSKLYDAAKNGETELVKLLIAAGADVNKANKWLFTPLYEAAYEGRTECVKLLIAAGADVNKANYLGSTPLYWAAENGLTECVKLLIAAGADVEKADNLGETPLYRAAVKGHTECVKLLIDAGADVNKASNSGKTPLYWAKQYGHTECAKLLRAASGNTGGIGGFFKRLFS